jgi:hypothetical protein
MSVSLERLARNQALFREVNERLLHLSDGSANGQVDFLCECSQQDCAETISLSLGEYNEVRARATLFAISPGHETLAVEKVLETRPAYIIVEKTNGKGFAVETDPRATDGAPVR